MARYGYLAAALAASAAAQTVPVTDSKTGIKFATFQDETTGASFGLALPVGNTGDLIGQLVAPISNSTGWIGLSLGAGMTGNLLVAAWPNEQEIVASFRKATEYATPPVFEGAVTQAPIPASTFVNSTHYSYTFLCSGCTTDQINFQGNESTGTGIGWAFSTSPVADSADEATPLTFHAAGQGIFSLAFADAQSADFAQWAALARSNTSLPAVPGSGSGSGSGSGNDSGSESGEGAGSGSGADAPGVFPPGAAAPTDAPIPGPTAAPSPTRTRRTRTTARPTATGRGGRGRGRTSRTSRTTRTRPTSSARAQAAPFRPAFQPDTVNGDDFADAQRFKASFLDGYYKGE